MSLPFCIELATLTKTTEESLTDYVIKPETIANSLRFAGENISDAVLTAIVLKGVFQNISNCGVTKRETNDFQ